MNVLITTGRIRTTTLGSRTHHPLYFLNIARMKLPLFIILILSFQRLNIISSLCLAFSPFQQSRVISSRITSSTATTITTTTAARSRDPTKGYGHQYSCILQCLSSSISNVVARNIHGYCSSQKKNTFVSTRKSSRSTIRMSSVRTGATSTSSASASASRNATPPPKHIVIVGAGIIGTSTAYYLSKTLAQQHQPQPQDDDTTKTNGNTTTTTTAAEVTQITMVDPTGTIAPAASGKAGGFLALNWNDYSPHALGPLARRGFELHSILANELGAERIMYRKLKCASVGVVEPSTITTDKVQESKSWRKPSGKKLVGLKDDDDDDMDHHEDKRNHDNEEWWNHENAVGYKSLGDETTIAQVHPKMLCSAMWEEMTKNPSVKISLVKGKVVGQSQAPQSDDDASSKTSHLWDIFLEDGTVLQGDAILYACGPWTRLGNCITGVKYHSVIIPTRPRILTQSVFFDGLGDPEVYPRPDGTAYCCGFPDDPVKVMEDPGQEEVRQEKVDEILHAVRSASGGMDGVLGAEPEIVQSCYLPSTPDNIPMMGKIEDRDGCYVAAGHGCWGILMGPATGEAMASLILTGNSSQYVNLAPFRPGRFGTL